MNAQQNQMAQGAMVDAATKAAPGVAQEAAKALSAQAQANIPTE
jgi:hypothetical protein